MCRSLASADPSAERDGVRRPLRASPDAAIIASVAVSAAACSGKERPWRESPPPPHSPPAPVRLLLIAGAYGEQTWTLQRGHSGPGGGWAHRPQPLGGGPDAEHSAAPAPSRRRRRRADAERRPGGAAGTEEDGTRPVRRLHPEQGVAVVRSSGRPAAAWRHDRVRLLPGSAGRDGSGDDLRRRLQGRRRPQAEGHGAAAKAAGEPLRPRAEARPEGHDVAGQAARGRADRPPAAGDELGRAGGHEPGRDPRQGRLPVQGAASPGAGGRARRSGLSPDADRDVPPPGAVRRRVRPSRGLPARVPARDVPPEPPRAR